MNLSITQKLKSLATNYGIVLLYHSINPENPGKPVESIHNISPHDFSQHIQDLSPFFSFVSLEVFSSSPNKTGLAAITFDDGYKNILKNAIPVLEKHQIPGTLFINGITFEGKYNWRDKVRHIIRYQNEQDFLQNSNSKFQDGRFYRFSKSQQNNSRLFDKELDRYFKEKTIDVYSNYPYLKLEDLILDHPLLTYGNHTYNHYVLSSLEKTEQKHEIFEGQRALQPLPEEIISGCFSAPFGGYSDITKETLSLCSEAGYHSILMSRQQLQPPLSETNKVQIIERFMPKTGNITEELGNV
jgi:peptidoglycan/xylan/chitin deacetylase (PgdA/CDA1 family)